jgi:glyoxylase-like metal-dependent hydrolase (beta-lactamase superfamily II)
MTAEWLESDLRRVRAQNPSPLTASGTNTYILGRGKVVVIDPGPNLPGHLAAILAALLPGESVTGILVTHCHLDHSALAPALSQATGAPTLAFGPAHSGRTALMERLAQDGLPTGAEGFDLGFAPDRLVAHGEDLRFGDLAITALHTPGHTGCHLSFAHQGRLFSGDLVMGWSTSLISPPDGDMAAYMNSLALLNRTPWIAAYPGHGDAVADPAARIGDLVQHRLGREAQVLAALGPAPRTLPDLTRQIYADTPPHLWPAAERNLLAHLIKLWQQGQVRADPHPGAQAKYSAEL